MVGGVGAHPAATPERSVTALRLRSGQVFPLLRSSVRGLLSLRQAQCKHQHRLP